MAAVIRTMKARPCAPVGYEVNEKVELLEDVVAGDLLKYTGVMGGSMAIARKAPAGSTEADGIALKNGYVGQRGFDMGVHGEMDGFSGMTPGASLYPSATVAGGLDTTAPTGATARVKAATATKVRFCFV